MGRYDPKTEKTQLFFSLLLVLFLHIESCANASMEASH